MYLAAWAAYGRERAKSLGSSVDPRVQQTNKCNYYHTPKSTNVPRFSLTPPDTQELCQWPQRQQYRPLVWDGIVWNRFDPWDQCSFIQLSFYLCISRLWRVLAIAIVHIYIYNLHHLHGMLAHFIQHTLESGLWLRLTEKNVLWPITCYGPKWNMFLLLPKRMNFLLEMTPPSPFLELFQKFIRFGSLTRHSLIIPIILVICLLCC